MPKDSARPLDNTAFPLEEADRCVMCGLCLPYCPTYAVTRNEGESPRGRIALMQGLARGALSPDKQLLSHLDHCLTCRACEAMCPSGVRYGRLIDAGRALVEPARHRPLFKRGLRALGMAGIIPRPPLLRTTRRLLRTVQRMGLTQAVTPLLGQGVKRLSAALPTLPAYRPWPESVAAVGHERGRVALFTGCLGDLLDQESLQSAITLLTRLGYRVIIPQTQVCCGALAQHNGDPTGARDLAKANLAAFSDPGVDAVLSVVSGCGAHLKEYGELMPDLAASRPFSAKVWDMNAFLAATDWPQHIGFAPLQARIAVHTPCSLRHMLKTDTAPFQLLKRLPKAEIIALGGKYRCCGAGGGNLLTEPDMAQRVLTDTLEHIQSLAPDILVSANLGCALHLRAGLRETGMTVEVMHPVTLLARQLEIGTPL